MLGAADIPGSSTHGLGRRGGGEDPCTKYASLFHLQYRGKKINFFVIKVDNRVLSFLDACARCYPAKRGYRCEGGSIICRECNVRIPISQIEKGIGSCYPIKVEGSLRDGRYLIPVSQLKEMVDKF